MKGKSKLKNYICIVVMLLVCVGLYCGAAFIASADKSPQTVPVTEPDDGNTATAPVGTETPVDNVVPDDDTPQQIEDIPLVRYPAEQLREGVTLPRDKYSLDMPQTERSDDVKAVSLSKTQEEDMTYFKGSVFVGDSVTLGLQRYAAKMRNSDESFMADAKFICTGSYGAYEATRPVSADSIHPKTDGQQMSVADAVAFYGAEKVFICLGLNDVGLFTIDEYLNDYLTLIESIRAENPGIKIFIESVTPLTLYGERRVLYNAKIDAYNECLAAFAVENNCYFADIADAFKDTAGYLAAELTSDDYCHLNNDAYAVWVEYLLNHAG